VLPVVNVVDVVISPVVAVEEGSTGILDLVIMIGVEVDIMICEEFKLMLDEEVDTGVPSWLGGMAEPTPAEVHGVGSGRLVVLMPLGVPPE
jgi:hypothetical protein